MSKPSDDPFYAVRDNVATQVERIKMKNEKFKALMKKVDTSSNADFKELRKGMIKDIRQAEKDLKGLRGAVETVEKNRAKFAHVKDTELALRKKFVDDTQFALNDVKNSMESPVVRKKLEDDENRSRRQVTEDSTVALRDGIERDNTNFIQNQKQQLKENIAHQDVLLEDLDESVVRLGKMGEAVNQELKEQSRLLDSLDNELEDASSRMGFVQEKLSKLLKTKDGCQIWTIVILTVILVIIVALLIWT